MARMNVPASPGQYAVVYKNLAGVDLSSEQRKVDPSRATLCENMFKKYEDGYTEFVETRPGLTLLQSLTDKIYGIFFLELTALKCIIHAGTKLYILNGMDDVQEPIAGITMAETFSAGFVHDKALYLLDGTQYLKYDGATCTAVTGTVPTTSIARTPAGSGTIYQSVNMLTSLRKNSFRADGTSVAYHLDAAGLDTNDITVTINGTLTSAFTSDKVNGIVTFTTAPAAPSGGDDNVIIQFGKAVTNNLPYCKMAIAFDNRFFYSGNPNYPNVLWHSEVNDPAYIPDVNYYKDGSSNSAITGMVIQDGVLIALKDGAPAIYTHTPTLDYDLGRIYPARESVITVGCVGGATAFMDDVVYLSSFGLEGLSYPTATTSERYLRHRSSLIDRQLGAQTLNNVQAAEWNGYLCLLFGDKMYLADSRGKYRSDGQFEYEWFVWTGLKLGESEACIIREYGGVLYLGTVGGHICSFTGTSDNGTPIISQWVTRMETGGTNARMKTAHEKGAVVLSKILSNSTFKIAVETNLESIKDIATVRMGGLDFADFDFLAMSFTTDDNNIVKLPLNEKKWEWLKLTLYSSRRFGLGEISYQYSVGNYIK